MKLISIATTLFLTIILSSTAIAESGEDGDGVQYIPLSPAIITNYQSPQLRYVKAEITLQVSGTPTAQAIERHLPYIRHNLVMLFSRQEEENLSTPEGKSQLKEDSLEAIVATLESEGEPAEVEAILFTSFIVE
ncbi:MAG: flagellar basal body rod protein [Moraxellaceae bacterium]|nr:MAG: flagellar basal body rod protein [Moraxellaceae bacterium]